MQTPLVIKFTPVDFNKKIVNNLGTEVRLSTMIAEPEMSLGFHYFLHRTKKKMKITNELDTKDKFYYILNPFEVDDELKSKTSQLLKFDKETPKILSRAFYKQWEINTVFNLLDKDELIYGALAEGPGSFLQANLHYRENYYSTKKDKYFAVTIHPEDGKNIEVAKNFLGYYKKEKPDLIKLHKTYKKTTSEKYKGKDNGDITNITTISNFKKDFTKAKRKANLVTGDGGFKWNNELYQEQESYPLIIGQILAGLTTLEKDGHLVIKFFETFTTLSCKLVYLISSLFEETYFYKPFFSRKSNSEKYLVAKKLKYKNNDKELKVVTSLLSEILEKFNSDKYVNNIFPKVTLPSEFLNKMRVINIQIANEQQKIINNMITYINENNYFGEKYHMYLSNHKEAIKFWIENFLFEKSKQKDTIKKWDEILKKILKSQDEEVENLSKELTL